MHRIVESLLTARGIGAKAKDAFLNPSLKGLVSPFALPGVQQACDVIIAAVAAKQKIVVFGDYDADGVCACAILITTLQKIGALVAPLIPRRTEGYGITPAAVERMCQENPDVALVITVDNGVNAVEEAPHIRSKGIKLVITDHHLPGEVLPAADALVDPKVASCEGCENLCGAGVAFYLANALAQLAAERKMYVGPKFGAPLLVMAGLATVADVMPLTDQNRIIVTYALSLFQSCAPVGLRELYQRSARSYSEKMNTRDFGFLLAPRLNATGRIDDALLAYNLLMAKDEDTARNYVVSVEGINARRKTIAEDIDREAHEMLNAAPPQHDAIALANAEWNSGVVGIVAARMMEEFKVPVAIYASDHGSARAPDGYNIHEILAECTDALKRFGGHTAAGGFTVNDGEFAKFRELFTKACIAQRTAIEQNHFAAPNYDAQLVPEDFSMELYLDLCKLEPFGECNPEPVFMVSGVQFAVLNHFGRDGLHFVGQFTDERLPPAKWWNHGAIVDNFDKHQAYDVFFTLAVSDWGGEMRLEMRIVDLRLTKGAQQ